MTEQQTIKYITQEMSITNIVQTDYKLLTPRIQNLRLQLQCQGLGSLIILQQQLGPQRFKVDKNVKLGIIDKWPYLLSYIKNQTQEQIKVAINSSPQLAVTDVNPKYFTPQIAKYRIDKNTTSFTSFPQQHFPTLEQMNYRMQKAIRENEYTSKIMIHNFMNQHPQEFDNSEINRLRDLRGLK